MLPQVAVAASRTLAKTGGMPMRDCLAADEGIKPSVRLAQSLCHT